MNDFVLEALVTVLVIGIVLFVAFLVYRKGLALRIFLLLVPTMGVISYVGFVLGKIGMHVDVLALTGLAAISVGTTTLTLMSRMVVKRISTQADNLSVNTSQLLATSNQAASSASQLATSVTEVTTTVEEINQMSNISTQAAQAVMETANAALVKGRSGSAAVEETIRIIEQIREVSDLVDVIDNIAEQSNLLAVNASIEAAKAGEQGRGFAVVATEVRNLSEKSKDATVQIREAIRQTEQARQAVNTVASAMADLAAVMDEAVERGRQISSAAIQQSGGIKQIYEAMQDISRSGQDTAAGARQLEQAVGNLNSIGAELRIFVKG